MDKPSKDRVGRKNKVITKKNKRKMDKMDNVTYRKLKYTKN